MSRRLVFGIVAAVVLVIGAGVAFAILRSDERSPEKAALAVSRGNAALAAGEIDEARAAFEDAIGFDDQSKEAHYDLGFVLQVYDQRAEDAEAEYRAAIDLDPAYTKALYSLAIIRANAQHLDEAIGLYRSVIKIDPNYAEAHFNLGLLLLDQGESAAGHAEIDQGVALKPSLGAHIATTTTTRKKR